MAFKLADTNYMDNATDITAQALEMLKGLKVYKYVDDSRFADLTRYCIAGQDLEKKVPTACRTDSVGMKYTDEVMLIPIIIGAINSLAAKGGSSSQDTSELEARVAALEEALAGAQSQSVAPASATTTTKARTTKATAK